METFISKTIDDILQTTSSFENAMFILPSQRASVFIKEDLRKKISVGFFPEIVTIETFVAEVAQIQRTDAIQLLFHFYSVYKSLEETPDTFDVFCSWAFTVLQDFNEIDQHLVDAKDLFANVRDINKLKEWSANSEPTELMKSHYAFTQKLYEYYTAFYQFLLEQKIGYQGLLYREATHKIASYRNKNAQKKIYFIGFNALNKAEEAIFQHILSSGNAEVYWDIDTEFLNSNHQAGAFIRKYLSTWNYYHHHELKFVGNSFLSTKNINVIGAPKNITQIKHVGELVSEIEPKDNTAIILSDESLLPIMLNSLPENVENINITMGYPLKNIPVNSLFFSIFQLFLSQQKLQKVAENKYYHKDVVRFFKESGIYSLLNNENSVSDIICERITSDNNTFVSKEYLSNFLDEVSEETRTIILQIFESFVSIEDFLNRIITLILLLKQHANTLEKEYLFRFYNVFVQLQNLHSEFNYFTDLKTLYHFFRQITASEMLSFQGEPLQGLQLMGLLETRVLDFKNIVLTSVNENILPANAQQNSFIPFDVKVAFGLPTYKDKDAIFSYHFFRLLQRSENIYLLYNTNNDDFGGGEKSRFIKQLELMRNDIHSTLISPRVITEKPVLKKVAKDEYVYEQLKKLAKSGVSPSALTTYLYNPIQFYKQKILKIKEYNEVEEEVGYNTLGTVVHETLDELYQPFVGKYLLSKDIDEMLCNFEELVQKYFKKHFKNGDITTGKNRLIYEVALRFVTNFLEQEKTMLSDKNNTLKILATEENLSAEIQIEGFDFPIKIHGQVDRVDELNGVIRVIDYKTGKVEAKDLKITDFSEIIDYKYHKAIQVLLYAFLYRQSKNINTPIQAGIYSFKNLNNGFLQMNFSSAYNRPDNQVTQERIQEFMQSVKIVLSEIYDMEQFFEEPLELAF